jgi:hypothetical protein
MAAGYDGHYMKRQKTDDGVRGVSIFFTFLYVRLYILHIIIIVIASWVGTILS